MGETIGEKQESGFIAFEIKDHFRQLVSIHGKLLHKKCKTNYKINLIHHYNWETF